MVVKDTQQPRERVKLGVDEWRHVVPFLKRPLPIGGTPTKWKDLHQGNLATLMRVNSTINEVTAPHLYRDVVTNNPELLVVGLEDVIWDGLKKDGRISATKRTLFGYTERLFFEDRMWDVMGISHEYIQDANMLEPVMPPIDSGYVVEAMCKLLPMYEENKSGLNELIRTCAEVSPFTSLDSISVQAFSTLPCFDALDREFSWEAICFEDNGVQLERVMDLLQPGVVCRHLGFGSYTPKKASVKFPGKKPNEPPKMPIRTSSWHFHRSNPLGSILAPNGPSYHGGTQNEIRFSWSDPIVLVTANCAGVIRLCCAFLRNHAVFKTEILPHPGRGNENEDYSTHMTLYAPLQRMVDTAEEIGLPSLLQAAKELEAMRRRLDTADANPSTVLAETKHPSRIITMLSRLFRMCDAGFQKRPQVTAPMRPLLAAILEDTGSPADGDHVRIRDSSTDTGCRACGGKSE